MRFLVTKIPQEKRVLLIMKIRRSLPAFVERTVILATPGV